MDKEKFLAIIHSPEAKAKRVASLKAFFERKGPSFMAERMRKSCGKLTEKQRSERSRKAWITRRAKAQAGG